MPRTLKTNQVIFGGMYEAVIRRGSIVISLVYLLKTTAIALDGIEYDFKTFNVQPNPIQFLREPDDHFTLSSVDVTFVCSLTISNKFSEISWVYNSTKIIKTGGHYNVSSKDQSISKLTIRNVSTKDQGDYHCFVSEWKTKARSKTGRLHVIGSRNTSEYNDNSNYKLNAVHKSTVILPCDLRSDTRVLWLKNQLLLDSKEFNDKTFIDKSGSLVLVNVSKDHSGHYQCQVNESKPIRNGSSYIVAVQYPIGSIEGPRFHTSSSSQYLLIAPNHCDKSPDNQTVTLQCPVTGHPSPVISWYLNGDLVNYNITDNIGNSTWIIQDEDPCKLIGYWQCFATNEAGTVHYEIRVLPYGWSTSPRTLTLHAINIMPQNDKEALALSYNISWRSPLYLGGLNLNDIRYNVTLRNFDYLIGEYITYNATHVIIDKVVKVTPEPMIKYWQIKVDIVCTAGINCKYLPSNVHTKASYNENDLIKASINFLSPMFNLNCFKNGSVLLNWSVRSSGNFSSVYINKFIKNWRFTGNCVNQQGTFLKKHSNGEIGGNSYMLNDLSNGTICNYATYYVYTDNFFKSPTSRDNCTIIMDNGNQLTTSTQAVNISASILRSSSQISVSSSDISSRGTAIITKILTTPVNNFSQINSSYLSTSLDVTKTSHVTFVQMSFSTLSIFTASTTYSTAITPTPSMVYSDNSNEGLSSGVLGTVIGLVLLLIISAIVCSVAVVMNQHKRHNEDYKFLKFSQYLKSIKSPLSNNYCSTINIANDSVCEMPVNKVMNWMDKNDFKQSTDVLQQASSFHSLPTSEMMAYICKKGKQKWPTVNRSHGIKHQAESLSNSSCSQLSISSDIPSHYHCEQNHKVNNAKLLSSLSEIFCDQNSLCNSEVVTLSENSNLQLQTICTNKKPTSLRISEKHTSMPLFTPKVTNPIFADTSSSQSYNETDLLSDILHTLPHEEMMVDNSLLSQMSDESDAPSHYLYEGNHCNEKGSLFSLDCNDTAHQHDALVNNSSSTQFDSEEVGDTTCNVIAPDIVASEKSPPSLSINKNHLLFMPEVTNPIFAENTNLSSNLFTSESSSDKDASSFVLHSQFIEEMNDNVFSQTSDVPSHYLYEGSCCNGKSQTSSVSLDGSTHSSSDNTKDSNHEMAVSPLNNSSFTNKTDLFIPRKSISLPAIAPDLSNGNPADITSADLDMSISIIESPDKSDSPKLCTKLCEQMNNKFLSQLSINDSISSHYIHDENSSSKERLSHYDEIGNNQDDHKTETTSSSQATKISQDAPLLDCQINETVDAKNVIYPLSPIFVSSPVLYPTNSPGTPTQDESYGISMEGLDLCQLDDSHTDLDFNARSDLVYDNFNAGYM